MKKITSVLFSVFFAFSVFAQAPQAFKYQTILRNASGEILANQAVSLRLSILQGSETGVAVYTETWDKTTNAFGLIVLNVGEGTSSDDFSAIAWGADVYYLKAEIDQTGGTNYSNAGTSQLLSVPYALYANQSANGTSQWINNNTSIYYNEGNVGIGTATPGKKLVIKATNDQDTLMEILDKDGNPLMVITPQLTKFNIIKDSTKAASGGFAVGRYALAKDGKATEDNNLFVVTPDSTRVYTSGENKAASGGFAVGRYALAKDAPANTYFYTGVDSTRIYINSEDKAASGGFAVGRYALAKDKTKGMGDYFNINVSNAPEIINPSEPRILWYPPSQAFLLGKVLIEHPDSVGLNSFAAGNEAKPVGDYSMAIGYQTHAKGTKSLAIGNSTKALAKNSLALGNFSSATGIAALSIGYETTASGQYATATGYQTLASGEASITTGANNEASGNYSFAGGLNAYAQGEVSFAMGTNAHAIGEQSFSIGSNTIANANSAFTLGRYNEPFSDENSEDPNSALLVIGDGTDEDNRHNAFVVLKNGNIGINTNEPSSNFTVVGDIAFTGSIFGDLTPHPIVPGQGKDYAKIGFVFKPEYKKQYTISEVENFINKNNRLPWISKEENHEKGINITRMSFETLETVANQQLQIISLKKENKGLEKRMKNQAAEIEKLKQDNKKIQVLEQEIKTLKKLIQK